MQALEAPALIDELRRQPVEQIRMRRGFPLCAEVIGCPHDRLPEMPAPDPIDQDPRRQRVFGSRQPAGECCPASRRGHGREVRRVTRAYQYGPKPRFDHFAWLAPLAPLQPLDVKWLLTG